ncbi:MAG: CRISPR system precrRNA processing endoribonuclease RAMP protein Cas6 [Bryobacteraceae bacterium]|nr:CRISPR system precrRNA processing endoribonuclease RAMP protein Cas6 [Bryobacteraceae bacterium]
MNALRVWPYRFHFVARGPALFPLYQSGNILRGAFGTIFRRIACEPRCPGAAHCAIAADCPYAQVFEPTWPAGPSGLADPPRAFVFRPAGLEGRALEAGEPFFFDLHLFSPRPDLLAFFVLTFRQLGVEGVGPGRVPVELIRVHPLDEQHQEQTAVFANGTLAGAASPGLTLALAGTSQQPGILRIAFTTPTEFKDAGSVALRPAFGPLFRRLANRIGNLCALYQGGRPDHDLAALAHSADHLRIAGGTVTWAEAERRSSRTGQKHSLGGFTGWVDYEGDYGPFLPWLKAGQWTGVGRQTVWGKGALKVSPTRHPAAHDQ